MTYAGNATQRTSQENLEWYNPDPTQLCGLVELTEIQLEMGRVDRALRNHYRAMRKALVKQREKLRSLRPARVSLSRALERNLRDLGRIQNTVKAFLRTSTPGRIDRCWEVLGELDLAVEVFQESTERLLQELGNEMRFGAGKEERICA